MRFEMIVKYPSGRETITRDSNVKGLLMEAASHLGPAVGSGAAFPYSGARGEIEIGVCEGAQVKLRVID